MRSNTQKCWTGWAALIPPVMFVDQLCSSINLDVIWFNDLQFTITGTLTSSCIFPSHLVSHVLSTNHEIKHFFSVNTDLIMWYITRLQIKFWFIDHICHDRCRMHMFCLVISFQHVRTSQIFCLPWWLDVMNKFTFELNFYDLDKNWPVYCNFSRKFQ